MPVSAATRSLIAEVISSPYSPRRSKATIATRFAPAAPPGAPPSAPGASAGPSARTRAVAVRSSWTPVEGGRPANPLRLIPTGGVMTTRATPAKRLLAGSVAAMALPAPSARARAGEWYHGPPPAVLEPTRDFSADRSTGGRPGRAGRPGGSAGVVPRGLPPAQVRRRRAGGAVRPGQPLPLRPGHPARDALPASQRPGQAGAGRQG